MNSNFLPLPAYGLTPSDVYPGYGGYAGAPSMRAQDAINTMVDNLVEALQRGLLSVKTRAAIGGVVLEATSAPGIARLTGQDRVAVVAGQITPEQWVTSAAQVANPLQTAAMGLQDNATVELISKQMAQAQQTAADIMAGRFGWPLWAWLLAGGAGAFVLWKLLGSGKKVRRLSDADFDDLEPEDALDGFED